MQECSGEVGEPIEPIELLVVKSLIDALLAGVAVQERRLKLLVFPRFFLLLFLRGLTALGAEGSTSKRKGR
jgi:hypothetical protein